MLIRSRTNPGSAWSCDFLAEIQRDKPIAFLFCSNLVTIKETLWLSQSTWSPLFRCCLASKMNSSVAQFTKKTLQCYTHAHTHNIIIMRGRFAYILQIYSEIIQTGFQTDNQVSSQKGVYSDALFQSSTLPTTKVTSRSCKKQRFLNSFWKHEHVWASLNINMNSLSLKISMQRQNSIWTMRSWSICDRPHTTTYKHVVPICIRYIIIKARVRPKQLI